MTTGPAAVVPKTLIAIATYRRSAMLSRLLASLEPAVEEHRVVVVDNDELRSAEPVVRRFQNVEYIHEPTPGIVAARNRALQAVQDETLIAFVDDDEWVGSDWLQTLYQTMVDHHADVVVGPVVPVFPPGTPDWATSGEWYQRKRSPTGTRLRDAPTNNTLVTKEAISSLDSPFFDEGFSITGGSDTELFTRVRDAGRVICWCDEAVVWEDVPSSRLSMEWVIQRQRRLGNVRGRIANRRHSKPYVIVLGLAYLSYSSVRLAVNWLGRRPKDSFAVMRFWRGVGILDASRGRFVNEYSRPPK